jgi:hypothetical protein
LNNRSFTLANRCFSFTPAPAEAEGENDGANCNQELFHEAPDHARAALSQRRVKVLATRALCEIYKMDTVAAPKLRSMSTVERDHWRVYYQTLTAILMKISKWGCYGPFT